MNIIKILFTLSVFCNQAMCMDVKDKPEHRYMKLVSQDSHFDLNSSKQLNSEENPICILLENDIETIRKLVLEDKVLSDDITINFPEYARRLEKMNFISSYDHYTAVIECINYILECQERLPDKLLERWENSLELYSIVFYPMYIKLECFNKTIDKLIKTSNFMRSIKQSSLEENKSSNMKESIKFYIDHVLRESISFYNTKVEKDSDKESIQADFSTMKKNLAIIQKKYLGIYKKHFWSSIKNQVDSDRLMIVMDNRAILIVLLFINQTILYRNKKETLGGFLSSYINTFTNDSLMRLCNGYKTLFNVFVSDYNVKADIDLFPYISLQKPKDNKLQKYKIN